MVGGKFVGLVQGVGGVYGVCVGYAKGVWVCAARGEHPRGVNVCGVLVRDISIYGIFVPHAWCVYVCVCVCLVSIYAVHAVCVFCVVFCVWCLQHV